MAIVKWEPFGEFDRFFDEFAAPSMARGGFDLAVDLFEEGNVVIAEMSLPGIDPEKIDITVEGQYLRVVGSREEGKERMEKQFYSKEIRRGSFERALRLPVPVDAAKVAAEYENGLLKIRLPKLEEPKKSKVKVVVR